jgi:hypothetical protein
MPATLNNKKRKDGDEASKGLVASAEYSRDVSYPRFFHSENPKTTTINNKYLRIQSYALQVPSFIGNQLKWKGKGSLGQDDQVENIQR